MTQRGKCDICRARKVKCDQKRPVCGSCSIRGRPCSYKAAASALWLPGRQEASHEEKADGLQLLTWSKASSGPGAFLKFGRIPLSKSAFATSGKLPVFWQGATTANPSSPLACAEASLASRWNWALDRHPRESNPFQVFGNFIEFLPSRLGRCRSVDLTAEYLLDVYKAYRIPTEEAKTAVHRSGARALASLRHEMSRQPQQIEQGDILWCTMLHYIAEQLYDVSTFRYTVHLAALCRVAKSAKCKGEADIFHRSLLPAICADEVATSMGELCDSTLDGITGPPLGGFAGARSISHHEIAAELVMRHLIRIPRLIRLVRALHSPDESESVNKDEIVQLALEIYGGDPKEAVERALSGSICKTTNPTLDPIEKAALPFHLCFTSIQAMTLFIDYHSYRILISGLLQTMFHLQMPVGDIDRATVFASDIDSAQAVISTLEPATSIDHDLPLVTLRNFAAIQYSYGACDRLHQRLTEADSQNTEDLDKASHLRQLCFEHIRTRVLLWRLSCSMTHEENSALGAASAGYPLDASYVKDVKWD